MNIKCLYCGHPISLGAVYDSYQGPVRCAVCKNLMKVEIVNGQMLSMVPSSQAPTVSSATAPVLSPPAPTAPPRAGRSANHSGAAGASRGDSPPRSKAD